MNRYFMKLCWKNVWRNKRRTFLTINGIAFGVMWLIGAHNYYDTFHEQLIDNVIQYQNGHLQISHPDYPKHKPIGKFIKNPNPSLKWLYKHKQVKAISPRVYLNGLLSSPRGSANIVFTGIAPKLEKRTTRFAQSTVKGNFDFRAKSHARPLVLGIGLADKIKVRLGDKVVALTQGVDGSIGNELFYVSGIFDTQSELDKRLAFVRLKDARLLASLPAAAVHQVSVILHSDKAIESVKNGFTATFPDSQYKILTWMEVQKHLMGIVELDKGVNRLFMFIILFIASVGIANSILMSILERTREFGVMMAIGTPKSEMVRMVFTETVLIGAVGTLLGNVLGILITLYFNQNGFDLKWLTDQDIRVNGAMIQTVSYPTIQWINNVVVSVAIFSLSVLAAVIPIHHISKLKTVKALKSI